LIKSFQPDNSPFIVGLVGHLDLGPTLIRPLIEAVVSWLLEIKQRLPDTDVRLMFDARNDANLAIARATLGLEISLDALIVAPVSGDAASSDPELRKDVLNHPQVQRIELAAKQSCGPQDILIRRASLLLACWDGNSSSLANDTADQVFRFLGVAGDQSESGNTIEVSSVADDLEVAARLVLWVPVRRGGRETSEGSEGSEGPDGSGGVGRPCYLLFAGDGVLEVQQSIPPSFERRLADLNEYNVEFERVVADGSLVRGESLLGNDPATMALSDASDLENIDRQFVKADSLAGFMQRRSDRLFNAFAITAFAMGLAYLIYDKITESKVLLMVYVLILLVSLLGFYFVQTKRWFGKYLSYRALAETLRVRFYLALAGVDRRMHSRQLIELTGIYRFAGFGWISIVLDNIESAAVNAGDVIENHTLRARLVQQNWIEDQYRYFIRKVASMERNRFWVGRLKSSVFIAVLIELLAMFMFGGALHNVDARTGLPFKNVLSFCTGCLAVMLGAWELRQNKMAVQELLWQYRNQLRRFQQARKQLQRTTNRGRRDAIVEQLGENSLMEIYLWAIHRYHREHAPPAAP
jgi:hypothetical protein